MDQNQLTHNYTNKTNCGFATDKSLVNHGAVNRCFEQHYYKNTTILNFYNKSKHQFTSPLNFNLQNICNVKQHAYHETSNRQRNLLRHEE